MIGYLPFKANYGHKLNIDSNFNKIGLEIMSIMHTSIKESITKANKLARI
jgi:hypothetical protein